MKSHTSRSGAPRVDLLGRNEELKATMPTYTCTAGGFGVRQSKPFVTVGRTLEIKEQIFRSQVREVEDRGLYWFSVAQGHDAMAFIYI
jgi:hypothetical protein